jgi:hypothetical protein
MDLFTMNQNFLADKNIDEFASAIWTERYTAAGDFQLVVRASQEWIDALAPGTFLGLIGSKEVMIVETQSTENGLLTVTGRTLLSFLEERWAWFRNPDYTADPTTYIVDFAETAVPGQFIADVVNAMVINPVAFASPVSTANLDWPNEKIPGLVLGPVDTSGVARRLTISTGPLYDAIQPVAEQNNVGISLYLDSASPVTGYVLKFTTYQGRDLTSDQSTYPLVRLSPDLDTLSGVKELNSISGYKNVAYVYYQGTISTHLADPAAPTPEGFARRILVVDAAGDPTTFNNDQYVTPAQMAAFRDQNAKDALANHNYIHAVDGETSPISEYKYGTDYKMGDILELESFTGALSKARVTEFIRSQDSNGEKAYPTISVIS